MDKLHDQLAALLLELEQELQRLALWGSTAPTPTALASSMPFCCDSMELSQWLQWIFIPRLHHLLAMNLSLPTQCSVANYAEENWATMIPPPVDLLTVIKRIDGLLSNQSP